MRRVVHRHDAGRGRYRRDEKDLLLSAGNDLFGRARTKMSVDDIGKERTRRLDDGPWRLSPSFVARWCPGPSLGSIVVHNSQHGGVLFTGRLCGFDSRGGDLTAFPLESEHSVKEHVQSLNSLADERSEFCLWLEHIYVIQAIGISNGSCQLVATLCIFGTREMRDLLCVKLQSVPKCVSLAFEFGWRDRGDLYAGVSRKRQRCRTETF